MRLGAFRTRQLRVLRDVRAEVNRYERLGAANIVATTRAFNTDYFNTVQNRARDWVRAQIAAGRARLNPNVVARTTAEISAEQTLRYSEDQIDRIIRIDI